MEVIHSITDMQRHSEASRQRGQKIAFVPTMGYLHDGHLSLVKAGLGKADQVVVSIFVNPTQFGPGEDLDAYPRDVERDLTLAEAAGAHIVFIPTEEELYPQGYETYVKLESLPNHLCGLSRPVHFRGVATIVTKLFNIVKPHIAVFGQKDFQQLQVIRKMVADLNLDVEIYGAPTVREADGLAMSSRNRYLNQDQRPAALSLFKSLKLADSLVQEGVTDSAQIIAAARKLITTHPGNKIDYITLCDPETLEDINTIRGPVLMALAVKVGPSRLIDNHILIPGKR